ncbi:hypothetical protein D3C78_1513290 [compost metagenome]
MKDGQPLSPKYWVGHNKKTDDVFVSTCHKVRQKSVELMDWLFGADWFMDEDLEVILIEIKIVGVQ